MGNIWLQDCKEYEPKLLKSLNLILLLSASVTKVSDTNTQGSLHQRDPILIADIRVSLVQGSMLLQLNVVIVAFLINIDKRKDKAWDSHRIFRYSRGQIDNLFTVWKAAFTPRCSSGANAGGRPFCHELDIGWVHIGQLIFSISALSHELFWRKSVFLCFYIIKSIARKGYFGPKYP